MHPPPCPCCGLTVIDDKPTCPACQQLIEANQPRIALLDRTYHPTCLMKALRNLQCPTLKPA